MPLYEYRCADCRTVNTILVQRPSDPPTPTCSHCGSLQLTRMISRVASRRSWGESLGSAGSEQTSGGEGHGHSHGGHGHSHDHGP